MKFELRVVFALRSKNWYERHHWSYQRRDIGDLGLLLRMQREAAGQPPAKRKRRVNATFFFKTKRRRDPTNYIGTVLADSMVRGDLLVDDSYEWVEWGKISFEKGEEQSILLEFEDL